MDNQQERFDLELSWLAGIIEGEGWVSLSLVKSLKRNGRHYPAFTPSIGVTNTDIQMMNKIYEIWTKLGLIYRKQIRPGGIGKDGICRKEKYEICVNSKENILKLANAIYPFMWGVKKQRIEKLYEFFKIRESKPKAGKNSTYGPEELAIYNEMYSYKGKSRSKIPNDYTFGSPLLGDEDIV